MHMPLSTALHMSYTVSAATDAAKAGFDDSAIFAELNRPPAERQIPMIQIMRNEALSAFRAWEENSGKIRY
jgi:hypothetical protein